MPTQPPESREVLRPRLETTQESPAHLSTGTDRAVYRAVHLVVDRHPIGGHVALSLAEFAYFTQVW